MKSMVRFLTTNITEFTDTAAPGGMLFTARMRLLFFRSLGLQLACGFGVAYVQGVVGFLR